MAKTQPLLHDHSLHKPTWRDGFAKGDQVILYGQVVDLSADGVKVEIKLNAKDSASQIVHPKFLQKVEVSAVMKSVLKYFCGYLDIWFLRETFLTAWADDSNAEDGEGRNLKELTARVDKSAEMMFSELNMSEWSKDDVPGVVSWTFGLYLKHILSPSVYAYRRNATKVHLVLGIIAGCLTLYMICGFAHLQLGDPDEKATQRGIQAFRSVEHAPVTPLVLLLCTHLIMMIFASKQLTELFNDASTNLPFPLTYTIIVGKVFMVFRMVLAYSSANLGLSIDYFVKQELILILLHAVLAVFVGDPSPESSAGPSYAKQLSNSCLTIFVIDSLKTFVMIMFWYAYVPGAIAYYVNRLPSVATMLVTSILIHAVLDLIQTGVGMFTMFIGRIFLAFWTEKDVSLPDPNPDSRRVSENAKKFVGTWIEHYRFATGLYQSSNICRYKIEYWNIIIPDGLSPNDTFEHTTLYEWSLPKSKIEVRVPEGNKAGDLIKVAELRFSDQWGTQSFNAADFGKEGWFKALRGARTEFRFMDDEDAIELTTFRGLFTEASVLRKPIQ